MSRLHSSSLRLCAWLLVLLPVSGAACGDGGEPEASAPPLPEAVPLEVEPLDDDDLAGLDPEDVTIHLPWGGGIVSRDPARAAPRATVRQARTVEHAAFDRLVLEFGTEAPFPGYRVAWADSGSVECSTESAPLAGEGPRPLLVRLRPAQAHEDDGAPTIEDTERSTGFPAVTAARQLCDTDGLVEWLLEVSDSTSVRVLQMREPPRLVVDVAHPRTSAPAADTAG